MPTFVSSTSSGIVTSTASINFSHTVAAGSDRKLVLFIETEHNTTGLAVTGVTYNGTSMTSIGSVVVGTGFTNNVFAFYLDDASFPTPGSYNVSVSFNLSASASVAHVLEFSEAAQGSVEATNSGTATSSQTLSTSITTLTDDTVIIGGISAGGQVTFTTTTGQTIAHQENTGGTGMAGATGYEAIATAGATSMGWDAGVSTNRLAQFLVAIADAGGGTGGGPITIETGGVATGNDDTPFNITVTGNDNRGVIVMVAAEDPTTYPSAVTVGGASATNIRNETNTAGAGNSTSMWVVFENQLGASGAKSVAVTYGGADQAGVVAVEIHGWDQVLPTGAAEDGDNGASVTSFSTSVTTSADDSVSIEVASHGEDPTAFNAAPTGDVTNRLTTMYNPPNSAQMVTGYEVHSTSGTKTATESAPSSVNRGSMIHAIFNEFVVQNDNAAIMAAHF